MKECSQWSDGLRVQIKQVGVASILAVSWWVIIMSDSVSRHHWQN